MKTYSSNFKMGHRGAHQMVHGCRRIDLFNPQPDDFQPEWVAHALASEARFAGNYGDYRVAQHAVLVARTIYYRLNGSKRQSLAGLHHEDAEAITGDIPFPVKKRLGSSIYDFEAELNGCVERRYKINLSDELVKEADRIVFCAEVRILSGLTTEQILEGYGEYGNPHYKEALQPKYDELILWSKDRAYKEFLAMHEMLDK